MTGPEGLQGGFELLEVMLDDAYDPRLPTVDLDTTEEADDFDFCSLS